MALIKFDLGLIFLVAELLLPSHFMLPLVAACVHAVLGGASLAQQPPRIWLFVIQSGMCFAAMVAFQKLHLFFMCWLAIILACPQQPMQHCRIGLFAIENGPRLMHHEFPMWWRWAHGGFFLLGLFSLKCSDEEYTPKVFVGDWSWTGLFLCKSTCLLCTDRTFQLAKDFKMSPTAIALLIAAPARWTKTSMAGLLTAVILTFFLPKKVKILWLKNTDLWPAADGLDEDASLWTAADWMEFLDSGILGFSFLGAWLAPWIASFVAALGSSGTGFDEDLFNLFLDQLMPTIVTPIGGLCSSPSLSLEFPLVPSGHLVLEATNLIAARRYRTDSLFDILQAELPRVTMEQVPGPRAYARVKISMESEDIVKAKIKMIARARGVRTTIKTVERIFYSPRD